MDSLASRIFPLCRRITGDGVRETLKEVAARIPLEIHEVPSGTKVLDWAVPDKWNIRDAYIANAEGRRVADFADSNLPVVSYSESVREDKTLEELRPHLHVHPERPGWIP
jgi:aminopeptidase-like protein